MKKLLISTLFLAAFGCDDDDDNVSRSRRDARLVDVEVSVEDRSVSDASVVDSSQPDVDSDPSPADMEPELLDSGLVDSEASDEGLVPLDALVSADSGADPSDAELVVVDASLEDM